MPLPTRPDLTLLLNRMLDGDSEAGNVAMHEMYPLLRSVAASKLRRERPNSLLQTTALVHDAMIRLFGTKALTIRDRQHFFALMCLVMRRLLIEGGRRKDPTFVQLDESVARISAADPSRVLGIERLLARLSEEDPEASRVFHLKVGAGMTGLEIADAMACGRATVNRALARARQWLSRELVPYLTA